MTHPCRNLRTAFGKWGLTNHCRTSRTAGGYEIIYGERHYRASLLAGAKTIKATIYDHITDDEAEDMSLSENLQREQVCPTEEARAFKRLLGKAGTTCTHSSAASDGARNISIHV